MITLGLDKLPRPRPKVEVRESYTETVISRMVAASAGVGDGGLWPHSRQLAVGGGVVWPVPESPPKTLRSLLSRLPCLTPWAVRSVAPASRFMQSTFDRAV